jgi:competence protein ComGC
MNGMRKSNLPKKSSESGQTLVASLIVIAIIAILTVVMLKGTGGDTKAGRPDGRGNTIPGMVKMQAEDTVCRSNLNQIRMAIGMRETTDGTFPSSLEECKLGDNFTKCPIGGERYQYDASTGKVFCPHLGHEKY